MTSCVRPEIKKSAKITMLKRKKSKEKRKAPVVGRTTEGLQQTANPTTFNTQYILNSTGSCYFCNFCLSITKKNCWQLSLHPATKTSAKGPYNKRTNKPKLKKKGKRWVYAGPPRPTPRRPR